jgi:hypothetical protein
VLLGATVVPNLPESRISAPGRRNKADGISSSAFTLSASASGKYSNSEDSGAPCSGVFIPDRPVPGFVLQYIKAQQINKSVTKAPTIPPAIPPISPPMELDLDDVEGGLDVPGKVELILTELLAVALDDFFHIRSFKNLQSST